MKAAITEIISNALESPAWERLPILAPAPQTLKLGRSAHPQFVQDWQCRRLGDEESSALGFNIQDGPRLSLQPLPLDTLQDGDAFFANDPYIVGVTHFNHLYLLPPVFYQNEIVAFVTAVAHHSDVCGRIWKRIW